MSYPNNSVGFQNPQEIITGKVIIEGTADGLFIYSGTGAAGNPPVLSAVAPGTTKDPFANAVQALLTVGLLAGAHTQFDVNGNISIVNASGDTVIYISPSLQYIGFYPLGLGNGIPIITIAANNGTDPDGFPYQSGFQVWGSNGTSNIELTDLSGVPSAFFSTGVSEETAGTSAVIEAEVINAGASEQIQWFLTGPRIAVPGTPGNASFTTAGAFSWTAPVGVTSVTVQATGGGGGSGSDETGNPFTSAGGGGGEYASQVLAVTPGTLYNGTVGAAGTAGAVGANNPGGNGGTTTFTGDSATVTANGGGGGAAGGGSGAGGAGGTGSTNTTRFSGGAGGANSNTGRGGGGGSSGGSASAGNPGVSGSGSGAGGAAVTGGGPGANAPASGAGSSPASGPGGGGGGANSTGTNVPGGAGWQGQVLLSWTGLGPANFTYVTMTGEAKDASSDAGGSLVYANLVSGLHDLLNWSAQGIQVNTMIPGDGNTYQVEEIRFVQAANQLINSTSAAQFLTTFDPGTGEYMVEGQILILTTAAAGAPEFQFAGTAVMSSFGVVFTEITEGAPGVMENVGTITALNQNFQGATLNNAGRLYKFEGSFICSTTGTLGIFAATTVAADTFTIQKAVTKMIYKPVGST